MTPYFDLHCDTIYELDRRAEGPTLRKNSLMVSLERASGYRPYCQVFAICDPERRTGEEAYRQFLRVLQRFERELEAEKEIALCLCADDLASAERMGRVAAILALEGADAARGSLEGLDELYNRGVRVVTLVWNGANEIASGALSGSDEGLTPFGFRALEHMEKLGIIVDVSHINERGFWDVAGAAKKPFIASHSNSAAVHPHPRNLTDEQFCHIVGIGGLVGISLYSRHLGGVPEPEISQVIRHVEHFLELGGREVVAIGADLDGAEEFPRGIRGVEDVEKVAAEMARLNYGQDLIDGLMYKNAHDFFARWL